MVRMLLYVAALLTLAIRIDGKKHLRVITGRDANPGEYPYVVSILVEYHHSIGDDNFHVENRTGFERHCSGSLITPTWVLTAAHCVPKYLPVKVLRVRFGDMTKPSHEAKEFFRKVLKTVPHPSYLSETTPEDIALMQTEEVPVKPGRLSAIEYKTLIGLPVTYAGYGSTEFNRKDKIKVIEDKLKPIILQIGKGGIIPCGKNLPLAMFGICVVAKCNNLGQNAYHGDSGGPLIYKDHIIGVAAHIYVDNIAKISRLTVFTPVSSYLEWISNVIQ